MSDTRIQDPLRTRKRRWRRWILFAVLIVAAGVAISAYLIFVSEQDLADAIAEADRLDPGWRFEDIEAARPDVPAAENSALVVAAAYAKVPANFMASRPAVGFQLLDADRRGSGVAHD